MSDYLALLNTLDENERLEAKRGSVIGPSVLETVCAFANEPGLQGRGSAAFYRPTGRLLDEGEDEDLPSDLGRLSSNPDGLSSNLPALSSNPMWQGLPVELQEMVAALGQRGNTDKVREAIIRLCQYRPWQAAELGSLVGRNPVYLGTHYLRPLVSAGVLAYTMPEQPNHPHQAYRTVEGTERGDGAT